VKDDRTMERDDETLAVETGVREVDRRGGNPGGATTTGEGPMMRQDAVTVTAEEGEDCIGCG
jgi:hypothetical protein